MHNLARKSWEKINNIKARCSNKNIFEQFLKSKNLPYQIKGVENSLK